MKMDVNLFLFDGFETLDLFGPVEILGRVDSFHVNYFSLHGGTIRSAQDTQILTLPVRDAPCGGIFLIPGGRGTRALVRQPEVLAVIRQQVEACAYCLSICTGSAVLARCGVLDHRRATSNKQAMAWVKSNGAAVLWADSARWCVDGKFYTASGVSAGIDMTLGFVCDRFGRAAAKDIAQHIEYLWNSDRDKDPFAITQ
jgi:putative intracellular protease/amidase